MAKDSIKGSRGFFILLEQRYTDNDGMFMLIWARSLAWNNRWCKMVVSG